ncbi:MAG: methionine--tRNA ligase [Candidatus Helarchaeota archaeon]
MGNTEKDKKRRKWIVTSAWPYINATPHLGTLIGSVLSADIFARYVRLKGDEVVFVSGSDEHGTPVEVAAIKEGISPEELCKRNHAKIKKLFEDWLISYDNYTHTHNPIHIKFTQDFYLEIEKNGFIVKKEVEVFYCPNCNLYLPDRFIEGTCPYCKAEGARGDQCDNPECGKLLEPKLLINPHCAICHGRPELRKTTHWYMDFPKVQEDIRKFIENNKIIPQNARALCLNSIKEGLPQRAITRDLKWGIPAKFKGSEGKTIYVWFEAVLGYISAVEQWAVEIKKDPSKFDYFWKDKNTRAVYFIGKDNIIFHLIVFPGLLFAYNHGKKEKEKLVMPYNISSTEFLMYEDKKFSKSKGVGIWIDDALELAPVDYWRYSLLRSRPEGRDSSFLWTEFQNHINELNNVIGNFIHRALTFINNYFNGIVPKLGDLDDDDKKFKALIESSSQKIGELLEKFLLKDAIAKILEMSREGNLYLQKKQPWHLIKENKDKTGTCLNLCIQMVRSLAIFLAPYCPTSAEKIWEYLAISNNIHETLWDDASKLLIQAGHKINKPEPLFQKINTKELVKKLAKIQERKTSGALKKLETHVSFEDFKKLDICTARIKKVKKVPNSKNLLLLTLEIGKKEQKIVAGIGEEYTVEELQDKIIIVVANLKPKKIKGIVSNGMLLAADLNGKPILLTTDKEVSSGLKVN